MRDNEWPRVLVISDAAWRDDNNIGNTFNDIFKMFPKENLAMIYGRPDLPSTKVCDSFYQISESRMIKRLFDRTIKIGQIVENANFQNGFPVDGYDELGNKIYDIFRNFRLNIFLSAREFLWKTYKIEDDLYNFIDDFNPDIVFNLATPGIYMNKLQKDVVDYLNIKSFLYFVDDLYTLKQVSISPIFWLNRIWQRKSIKKTVGVSSEIFVISELMKKEYDKIFQIDSTLLTKYRNFDMRSLNNKTNKINTSQINFTYTGNLIYGRLNSIILIGKALDKINEKYSTHHVLNIYSGTKLSKRDLQQVSEIQSIRYHGFVSSSLVAEKQKISDVLVHVESFNIKQSFLTRLSFSTKLVDYFQSMRCIFAVGDIRNASIQYLLEYGAASVATDEKDIYKKILCLVKNPNLIDQYATSAYILGNKKHNKSDRNSVFNVKGV